MYALSNIQKLDPKIIEIGDIMILIIIILLFLLCTYLLNLYLLQQTKKTIQAMKGETCTAVAVYFSEDFIALEFHYGNPGTRKFGHLILPRHHSFIQKMLKTKQLTMPFLFKLIDAPNPAEEHRSSDAYINACRLRVVGHESATAIFPLEIGTY